MKLLDVATLYVSLRTLNRDYARLILVTAKRFDAANPGLDVSNVNPLAIANFMRWLVSHTGNANTQAGYLRRLRSLLSFAKECGWIREIPPIPKVRVPKPTPRAWGLEEFRRLYEVANCLQGRVGVQLARVWWPSLIATAYHTASRIGALLSVKWSDLDIDRRLLVLRAENTKTKREQVFALPEYVIEKIQTMKWPPRELVWEWPHNRRYLFVCFRKKILRPAQLEPLSSERFSLFHKIRRTAASVAVLTCGLPAAQTLLGHTSARTTLEHYVDPRIAGGGTVSLPPLE